MNSKDDPNLNVFQSWVNDKYRDDVVSTHILYTTVLDKKTILSYDRIIIIDSDWCGRKRNWPDFYFPLWLNKICKTENIHCTWIIENCNQENDDVFRLWYDSHLVIKMGILIRDDLSDISSIFNQNAQRNFAFEVDIVPIVADMIYQGASGMREVCNPHHLSISTALEVIREFESLFHDLGITIPNEPFEDDKESGYQFNTDDLEQKYFVLPAYQAFQRSLKRVRKRTLLSHQVDLDRECRILITGGFGFIGSNLIHYLFHHYPKTILTNIDRLDYCSREEHVEMLLKSDRFVNYKIDLVNTDEVYKILCEREIEYVFHLAAQSHVDNSFNNSLQFSKDNVYGTHSLLEACKNYGNIKRFVHISTDEIYGETVQMKPFAETELPNPTNPYAATKVGAEYIAKSYYHCFELPVIIIRGNNVYGPRQYPEKMIPRFISLLLNNEKCTIAGNGMMKRNFVHVTDICAGLCVVLEKGKVDEIYNIGDDDEKCVLEVALGLIDIIKDHPSNPEEHYKYVKDRYYNDFRYSIDSSKIRKLGWKPQIPFSTGLENTIKYYKDHTTRRVFSDILK